MKVFSICKIKSAPSFILSRSICFCIWYWIKTLILPLKIKCNTRFVWKHFNMIVSRSTTPWGNGINYISLFFTLTFEWKESFEFYWNKIQIDTERKTGMKFEKFANGITSISNFFYRYMVKMKNFSGKYWSTFQGNLLSYHAK